MNFTKGEWKVTSPASWWRIIAKPDEYGSHILVAEVPYLPNANLIAAAPLLYEALREINATKHPMDNLMLVQKMIKALRKAEGREV